ncbi:MAG: sigma 54-interacting transcriptional regulator [Kofleriaceae bacterium]
MEGTLGVRGEAYFIRRFAIDVVDGVDRGRTVTSSTERLSIGTSDGNDLRLTDPSVSRHHCELRTSARGLELRDLGSTNGTFVGECEIVRGFVQHASRLRVGHTTVVVRILDDEIERPLAATDHLGSLVGASPVMRRLYPLLEQCAASESTVLLNGETGTGKDLVAQTIHEHSPRRTGPFVVLDCSALPHELAESELFGHERGAFTGAVGTRIGAFEEARGGTIFLDEIGELPAQLQPLLLRALEARTIKRIGGRDTIAFDARVIAGTHRDLRALVNAKQFRADLYYRLHVVRIELPALRDRPEDIPLLAAQFWKRFRSDRPVPQELLAALALHDWPGNVRELRNAVERAALFDLIPSPNPDMLSYQQAKDAAILEWERVWAKRLLLAHSNNLSHAARAAQMGRSNLRSIARRHGLLDDESVE